MPPNIADVNVAEGQSEDETKPSEGTENNVFVENGNGEVRVADVAKSSNDSKLRIFMLILNLLAHILVVAVTVITITFAFQRGLTKETQIHIILCVSGYILLMAEAILSISSPNFWSSPLRLVNKRRVHYILQLLGSGLAIGGSFLKIADKSEHWTTLHGRFALVALVFTSVSLVNGLASLLAYELRGILPGTLSKLTHICFGTVGFSAACIGLCYGFEKDLFKTWKTDAIAYTMISFTATLGFIVILSPAVSFYQKSKALVNR